MISELKIRKIDNGYIITSNDTTCVELAFLGIGEALRSIGEAFGNYIVIEDANAFNKRGYDAHGKPLPKFDAIMQSEALQSNGKIFSPDGTTRSYFDPSEDTND